MMRIGIDCRLPAYHMGGISQYLLYLLPALAQLDEQNSYHLFHSFREKRDLTPPNAGNFHRHTAWTPCHHRLEQWSLGAELLPHRLELHHSPDFIPPKFGAKRFVITVHDLNFIYYPQYLTEESRRYYLHQIEWATRHAAHISADSEQTRQDLIEQLKVPAKKVTTIPLAANPLYSQPISEHAAKQTLAKYKLPAGYILFVGTLEPRKNIPTLLQAYAQLRAEQLFDLPLLLVGGKGWLYEEIFATIERLNLSDDVIHLQGISDSELAHLYKMASVLTTPSHYEGFGLPALEAMHCGCPIILSDRGSLPEVAGNAGIILPPEDISAWANSISKVVTDSECRQKMIDAGKQQATKFNWQKTARLTLSIYQQAITQSL